MIPLNNPDKKYTKSIFNKSFDSIRDTNKTKNEEIILKNFHNERCQPCKIQDSIIEELNEIYKSKIKFENINVFIESKYIERFKIFAIPTLIIQKNGIEVNRFIGITSKKTLENELDNLLKNIY